MKIDKAIKTLTEWHWPDSTHPWTDMETAIKLGIEALKSVRTGRKVGLHYEAKCLLGETEE